MSITKGLDHHYDIGMITRKFKTEKIYKNYRFKKLMDKNKKSLENVPVDQEIAEEIGENHEATSLVTPMRKNAFDLTDDQKIAIIEEHFASIMHTMGLDLEDESLSGTPYRVAKMYVKEIFNGLKPENKPVARKFGNKFAYQDMVVVKDIDVTSFCEHHFLPFVGKAHVAYISTGNVIGLSKINRIVDYFSRRPQVQERLTLQIADELKSAMGSDDVAVFLECKHLCVSTRGIKDRQSSTVTTEYSGKFRKEGTQQRFIDYILANTEM